MAFCARGGNDACPIGVTLPDETSALADLSIQKKLGLLAEKVLSLVEKG